MNEAKTNELAKRVEFDIVGMTPLSFGRAFVTPREQGEDADVYERRVWRERMHTTDAGEVYIPPLMMKRALEATARYMSESVPGKKRATFTKHFMAGCLIADPILLGIQAKDVACDRLLVASDGKPNSKGGKVMRNFPLIPHWRGHVVVHLLDPVLQKHWDKVIEYAENAGSFNGLGRFAPRVGGYYGRYTVENAKAYK